MVLYRLARRYCEDIIERDVSQTFDQQMADSRLQGDALNKEA